MLRIKHKNISMQFVTLLILFLCYDLTMSLWLTPARAAQRRQQHYYVVDAYQTPGVMYRIINRKPSVFFRRRLGSISSIAIFNEQLYFCSANDKKIYQKMGQREKVIFENTSYVRDVAVDPSGNLYFTEASGAGGDGKIYKLSPAIDEPRPKGFSRKLLHTVELKKVDGFWTGDFTFDVQGNLYLSSGNRTPAFIYKVSIEKGSGYSSPRKIYKDTQGAIKGIAIDPSNPNFAYYADWRQTIYRLDIRNLRRSVEFSGNIAGSSNPHLSDVAFDVRIRSKK